MQDKIRQWCVGLLLLLLSGCASSVDCKVTSTHTLNAPQGEMVLLVYKDASKTSGPEFRHYAAEMTPVLSRIGYRPVAAGPADLIFEIQYGVGPGREELSRLPRCSMRYHFRPYEPGGPLYYGMQCFDSEIEIREQYVHFLELKVRRTDAEQTIVYEGLVHGLDASADLPAMMPYLIAALFDEFPGVSGQVRSVSVERAPGYHQ